MKSETNMKHVLLFLAVVLLTGCSKDSEVTAQTMTQKLYIKGAKVPDPFAPLVSLKFLFIMYYKQNSHATSFNRTALAQRYFPDLLPLSAWAKFRRWLLTNPRLKPLLASKSRSFTPAQVALIYSEIGEP
jgi:hypothetical protein